MHVVILAALFPEARALARAFHLDLPSAPRAGIFAQSSNLTIALTGLCAVHLKLPLTQQLESLHPAGIIMAGIGGGLAPSLKVGDVVCQGFPAVLPPSPFQVMRGTIATARGIVSTPAQKRALHQETGAVAVDMETGIAQSWAQKVGIPFVAVRSISDSADDYLDPSLLSLIDDLGRPRLGRSLGHLAAHPTKLPALLRLQRNSKLALSHLAIILPRIILTPWPPL